MRTLQLALKGEYFDAIRDGSKLEEYRLYKPYWIDRLGCHRQYDRIVLTKGYPKADDESKRMVRKWVGADLTTITHKHFGDKPVTVFAIDVSVPL